MKRPFAATVWREGNWYVSQCLEVDVASAGQRATVSPGSQAAKPLWLNHVPVEPQKHTVQTEKIAI